MALVAHGGEVRAPAAHQARNKWSLYNECDEQYLGERVAQSAQNRAIAVDSGVPLFVSTPDLLNDLPTATWLPICLDPSAFANDEPLMERAIPRALHIDLEIAHPKSVPEDAEEILKEDVLSEG